MTDKDRQLISILLKGTETGRVKWQPTASDNQFSTSLTGKFNLTIRSTNDEAWFTFSMADSEDRQMVNVSVSNEEANEPLPLPYAREIRQLFYAARREALAVDQAIDEIIDAIGESPTD